MGVIYAIVKNGRASKKQEEDLKRSLMENVKDINERLDNENTGLGAIKTTVDNQHDRCLEISTAVNERLKADRRDIDDLKSKRRG